MVRRHPHVFSDTTYESQSEQLKDWDRIKREEKAAADAEGPKGTYDSLPRGLPPLTKAYRIHSKADRVGFTWPENEDVEKQVEAEWLELLDAMASDDAEAIEHEFGDHMFTLVELCLLYTSHLDMASSKKPPVFRENRISGYSQNTMKMWQCEACHANPNHLGSTNASNACFVCHK